MAEQQRAGPGLGLLILVFVAVGDDLFRPLFLQGRRAVHWDKDQQGRNRRRRRRRTIRLRQYYNPYGPGYYQNPYQPYPINNTLEYPPAQPYRAATGEPRSSEQGFGFVCPHCGGTEARYVDGKFECLKCGRRI